MARTKGRPRPAAVATEVAALREQLTGGRPMLLMVGRLAERHKGFDTAIAALPDG